MEKDFEKYEELEPVILAPGEGPYFAIRRSKVRRLPNGHAVLIEESYSVELADGTHVKRCATANEAVDVARAKNSEGRPKSTLASALGLGNEKNDKLQGSHVTPKPSRP